MKLKKIMCKKCNKKISTTSNRKLFCNTLCRDNFNKEKNKNNNCLKCNNLTYNLRFCSRKCSYSYQLENNNSFFDKQKRIERAKLLHKKYPEMFKSLGKRLAAFSKINNKGVFVEENRIKGSKMGVVTNKKNKTGFYDKKIQALGCEKARIKNLELNKNKKWKTRRIKSVIKALRRKPSIYEQKVSDLCLKYNLPFVYKGDGDFLINFKNPDFINKNKKIAIEVFYSWYKIRDYGSVNNYKKYCINKYTPFGWKVIFIDELDLNNKNWEDVCLNKINKILINGKS